MTSNSDNLSSAFPGMSTLAEMVSSVFPNSVPSAVQKRINERMAYAKTWPSWTGFESGNVPQILTALILLEQSPACAAWNLQLDAIPSKAKPSDTTRYTGGTDSGGTIHAAFACVEWAFNKSGLSHTAPMATVTWQDTKTPYVGYTNAKNAICRMLYAAQNFQPSSDPETKRDPERLDAMERKIAELEARIATLQVARPRVPTVTCLMHLFAVDSMITFSATGDADTDIDLSRGRTTSGTGSAGTASSRRETSVNAGTDSHSQFCPRVTYFTIAPHTDRLSDLSTEAQDWFLRQLETRKVWVHATDPESEDNHISWAPFAGAVEMGRRVIFSHGNHRFW